MALKQLCGGEPGGQGSNPVWSSAGTKKSSNHHSDACLSITACRSEQAGRHIHNRLERGRGILEINRCTREKKETQNPNKLLTLWSLMEAAQELISHRGLKINHFILFFLKPYQVWISFERKSPVTAGCQSLLFLTVQEHKSGLMYITIPTTSHSLNLFF